MLSDVDLSQYTTATKDPKPIHAFVNSLYHLPAASAKFPGAMVAGLEWSDLDHLFCGFATSHVAYRPSEIIRWISPPQGTIAPSNNAASVVKRVIKPKPTRAPKLVVTPSVTPLPPPNHVLKTIIETIDFGPLDEPGFAAGAYE
jgi:hypothetical protein